MALNRIVRHTIPNKYDSAEFGTLCQANYNEDSYDIFIQLSHTDEAQWEPIGYLLEKAFEPMLENEEFIQEVLVLLANNKSFENIATLLLKKKSD
jgi:hypothetical protein